MQPKPLPNFDSPLAALEAGIAEANHRERGQFDGLLGQLPDGASKALKNVVSDLRDHLLDRYSETDARRLLQEYEPRPGFRSVTPVPDDVDLALRLLNGIRSAMRCSDDDPERPDHFTNLIFGKVGVRDKARKAVIRRAGRATGKARADEAAKRHEQWHTEAAQLVANGKTERNVAAILASRHGVAPSTIRKALKKTRAS
jgi:hypothetical protein